MNLTVFLLWSVLQLPQPELIGAELSPWRRAADLEHDIVGVGGPAWVGYRVAAVAGGHGGCSGVFDLDSGGRYTSSRDDGIGDELYVFVRVIEDDVVEVRSVTSGCRIRVDTGPVYWLSSASSVESLEFLEGLARRDPSADLAEESVHAIAWHAGGAADERLEAFATSEWPLEIREKAVFWMGAARGERGFHSLKALSDSVSERELREKIVFALHVSDADDATGTLIEIARADPDSEVREQALFWLGQEAGERAASAIVGAIRDDPDIDVKKKAVFALSQLPPNEGVPLLIEVAETHRDPEIRKKAFFWLGQSGDARALALFERVLSN